jgi:hypothetical protein
MLEVKIEEVIDALKESGRDRLIFTGQFAEDYRMKYYMFGTMLGYQVEGYNIVNEYKTISDGYTIDTNLVRVID